ncbi:hypothetical protein ONE63_008879 [Megalurothrips usitatus]|uniref:Uncharacterized protein n=1 Tax=Megalurothrips usitatus TaxID=439358 RepID=A0AAV7XLH1_9NEOP|nr:hypothetical protein ONE63_008879 [Megalurothrips usitatus]
MVGSYAFLVAACILSALLAPSGTAFDLAFDRHHTTGTRMCSAINASTVCQRIDHVGHHMQRVFICSEICRWAGCGSSSCNRRTNNCTCQVHPHHPTTPANERMCRSLSASSLCAPMTSFFPNLFCNMTLCDLVCRWAGCLNASCSSAGRCACDAGGPEGGRGGRLLDLSFNSDIELD